MPSVVRVSLELGGRVSMYGRVLSRGRRWLSSGPASAVEKRPVFGPGFIKNDRVVIMHGEDLCCTKHPERTHVDVRGEASLREG
jgi:hypothetical protein